MIKKEKLNPNIILYKKDECFYEETVNIEKSKKSSQLIICINLNGETEYQSLLSDYKIKSKKNHTIMSIINQDDGISKTLKDTHKQFVSLIIPKNFLEENLPRSTSSDKVLDFFESSGNVQNISYKKTDSKTKLLAYEIFNNQYKDNLEKLFIESRVLELIYTEFKSLFQDNKIKINETIKFSNQDKESVYHARDILINNLSNPPSMKELAKMVALNDLKLKVGFNKFFQETPYSISIEYRLQRAKELLQKKDLNVNEISEQVGYKYPQSFSNAFIKRFGVRPKDLRKSGKTYYL